MKKTKASKVFGKYLWTNETMKKYLSKSSFSQFQELKKIDGQMDFALAEQVAVAMKKWAICMGATHFTHWFQPLTGKIAEKHEAFIDVNKKGITIENFGAKALTKNETDASSFPNGGERLTFEARGYTIWDYTSPAFIKSDSAGNKVLYIPTAFCSYKGQALDQKTPLLRAMEVLNSQSLQLLQLLGYKNVKKVVPHVGCEQEYFLIKRKHFQNRPDLIFTGRTLFGGEIIKSQEAHHHYYGVIKDEVSLFMHELNSELWKVGVMSKVQHNEVAPAQHEIVSIFTTANITADQNQITMEIMSRLARKHGFEVLFHEKPFANLNGSGKHNNWSLITDTGMNLMNARLKDNTLFLLFFTALLSAIDEYAPLLQMSAATQQNDLRLGGFEAPPSIISVYVGDDILDVIQKIEKGEIAKGKTKEFLDIGVNLLPKTFKDNSDRNRTSPFAFTGDRFEFRMLGSSQTLAFSNVVICTILANKLKQIIEEIKNSTDDMGLTVASIIKENIVKHKKIIFNGNGYDAAWHQEAKKRKLKSFSNAVDAYSVLSDKAIIKLFKDSNVLSESELKIRQDACYLAYIEGIDIELKTARHMLNKQIIPSLLQVNINNTKYLKATGSIKDINNVNKINIIKKIDEAINMLIKKEQQLEKLQMQSEKLSHLKNKAEFMRDNVRVELEKTANVFNDIEIYIPKNVQPFPSYNEILF